eukprot:SAG31_NODE_7054_length_1800_cov_1.843805_2_plen_145_part_00
MGEMEHSSSDDDIFGGAASWMQDDESGGVEVEVSRADAAADETVVPENWKFKRKDYWDARFQTEKEFEWLASFAEVEQLLAAHIRPADRILVVGCGNSPFSRSLYEHGYTQITNIDFSAEVSSTPCTRMFRVCKAFGDGLDAGD